MAPKYLKDQPDGFVNNIKNVAIVGAAGQLGTHITTALLKTGQHNVTALTRHDSKSTFSGGVKIARVNYDEHSSLVDALRGQDALVITMNAQQPKETSIKLVEAAIDAGVPWILPSEWGGDYKNREMNRDIGLGDDKLEIRQLIESKGTNSAFIAVACGFWYEYSLVGEMVTFGFDFAKKEAKFYDDGTFRMPYSTLAYCGQAVGKLLSLPILTKDEGDKSPCLEDYRNDICRVHCFDLDQRDMLASILRVTGDKEGDWTISHESPEIRFNQGKQRLQSGDITGWRLMLYSRMFYASNPTWKAQTFSDERLGLQPPSLDDETKWAIEQVEKTRE